MSSSSCFPSLFFVLLHFGNAGGDAKYEYPEVMDYSGWERLDYEAFAFHRVYRLNTEDRKGLFYKSGLDEGEICRRIWLVYRRLLHEHSPSKQRRETTPDPPQSDTEGETSQEEHSEDD
jgi:hypothetical protein